MFHASRWESFVWPRWLPERARLPLIAQITGAVALTALLVAPWWSNLPQPAIVPSPASARLDAAARTAVAAPAHLNLDVRHTFKSVELSVTVDGKPALRTELDGSAKRFKVFGKRAQRGFTQTLDLAPGVRVVRVRVKSAADKFDQTRVERFDLAAASVAAIKVSADRSGLSLVARHPPPLPEEKAAAVAGTESAGSQRQAVAAGMVPAASPARAPAALRASQAESTMLELVQSLRSMLIAIAGFVASAATGFVVQEFLRRRRGLLFAETDTPARAAAVPAERRRRRRAPFV